MSDAASGFWTLDPEVTFLNHGSFGATPRPVQEAQARWRRRVERQPVRFYQRERGALLDEARETLARFLGADPANLAFVPNATAAINAVLRSYDFRPGDEILLSDHVYDACRSAAHYVAGRTGAAVTTAHVPFPVDSEEAVVDAYLDAVSDRTRLAIVEHVTSPTALVFPAARLSSKLAGRGVDVLVDGAHAPGMVPVDVQRIGAAYYAGNCHKWLCAPKGAGFLAVDPDRRHDVAPAVVSSGLHIDHETRSRFHLLFDWTGTDDPSAYLSVPAAVEALASLHGDGIAGLMASNRQLALEARRLLSDRLDVPLAAPDSMIGSMASIPLPPSTEVPLPYGKDPMQDRLLFDHGIEVPIEVWPEWPNRNVRISVQAYNELSQYETLADALLSDPGRPR